MLVVGLYAASGLVDAAGQDGGRGGFSNLFFYSLLTWPFGRRGDNCTTKELNVLPLSFEGSRNYLLNCLLKMFSSLNKITCSKTTVKMKLEHLNKEKCSEQAVKFI